MFKYTTLSTPVGEVTVASLADVITGVFFEGPAAAAMQHCYTAAATPALKRARTQLAAYFAGELHAFSLPLDPLSASLFEERVHRGVRAIAYGQVVTYDELARTIGCRGNARAVRRACRTNPLPILVPCHRIRDEFGPGPYCGGEQRKLYLQELEAAHGAGRG